MAVILPPQTDLFELLKLSAEANRRSLNSEVIACIERGVASQPVDPQAFLQRARQLREKTAAYRISNDDFDHAKGQGRP